MDVTLVPDHINRYHPYTVAYRQSGSERYLDFGSTPPLQATSCIESARKSTWHGDRDVLSNQLRARLTSLGAPEAVLENARQLADPKTFALVAGHQPSLFGGPLFLFAKILSIVKLSKHLNSMQDDVRFVPVYWNGSEEHNRAEFGRVTLFDSEHDLLHLTLPDCPEKRMAAATSAKYALPLIDEVGKLLPQTEFLPDLLEALRHSAQGDLGEMMSRLMLHWFGRYGLIVVEPRTIRPLAVPVIKQALSDPQTIHDLLGEDTKAMKDMGFHPPLPHHEAERTLVYLIEEGRRYRIRKREGIFHIESRDKSYPEKELFKILENEPERFSPSAALRPIVQAAVLPVTAYIAGGGELAYHVQLRKLYSHLDQQLPLLIPRAALTIFKPSLRKTMHKLQIEMKDLLSDTWTWDTVSAESVERIQMIGEAFDLFAAQSSAPLQTLEATLAEHGINNFNELQREYDRFIKRLGGVQTRYEKQAPAESDNARRQYFRLRKFILPAESYQELSGWGIYFMSLFGQDIFERILSDIDPLTTQHHVCTAS